MMWQRRVELVGRWGLGLFWEARWRRGAWMRGSFAGGVKPFPTGLVSQALDAADAELYADAEEQEAHDFGESVCAVHSEDSHHFF